MVFVPDPPFSMTMRSAQASRTCSLVAMAQTKAAILSLPKDAGYGDIDDVGWLSGCDESAMPGA
jgi:hypothetical protein